MPIVDKQKAPVNEMNNSKFGIAIAIETVNKVDQDCRKYRMSILVSQRNSEEIKTYKQEAQCRFLQHTPKKQDYLYFEFFV